MAAQTNRFHALSGREGIRPTCAGDPSGVATGEPALPNVVNEKHLAATSLCIGHHAPLFRRSHVATAAIEDAESSAQLTRITAWMDGAASVEMYRVIGKPTT